MERELRAYLLCGILAHGFLRVHGYACGCDRLVASSCSAHRLDPSMSRRRNRWEDAVAESFFSSLKKERIRKQAWRTRDLAKADIFEYIEMFYDRI